MGRDLAMAFAFGDHPSVAAFMVAFRLSNLFRRLLGEGPFQSVFIPHYEGLRVQKPHEAGFFFRRLSLLLVLILLGLTAVAEAGIWIATQFQLAPSNLEILQLSAWMFPGLLFICLYGLNISLLNCHDSFFVPSFAPFICNAIWIAGALWLQTQETTSAMASLSKLIVIGFAGQWLLTLPLTLRFAKGTLREWISFSIPQEIKQLAKSFSYGIIGVGAVQINALVDSLFARHADLRGPVYLWYSIRIEQLVLAVFGIACISTVIPRLSRALKNGEQANAEAYFALSFRRIMAVMIPCTVALFVLGSASVNLLYGRGHFLIPAIDQTTFCLWAYAIGLIPAALVILYSAIFFARADFKTPMRISLLVVLLNMALNGLFVFGIGLGAISTALATSACAWINFAVLGHMARKEGWDPGFSLRRLVWLLGITGFASLCAWGTSMLVGETLSRKLTEQVAAFGLPAVAFAGTIWGFAKVFKNKDLLELFEMFSLKKTSKVQP